jgi:hypothetical protein
LALTRYAGASNKAWPAYNTLARDVSCCKRRAIDAVNVLIACGLVEKKCRRNRTNVYLLYPPEYFRKQSFSTEPSTEEANLGDDEAELIGEEEFDTELLSEEEGVHDMHFEGAPAAPLSTETGILQTISEKCPIKDTNRTGVQVMHARGAPPAPGGCTRGTQGLHVVHPKSTNINNKGKLTLQEAKAVEERVILERKFREEDFEQVKKVFKAKGVQVTEVLIRNLLKTYDVKAVQAAITSCDFSRARNPLALIKWMLQTGNYVMPVERITCVAFDELPPLDPAQDEEIKRLIRQAKAGLQRKLILPETPEPVQSFSMR